MAASPRRHTFVDTNNRSVVAVVQMITHMHAADRARTEVFMVGGGSFVAQGTLEELQAAVWP